MFYLLQLSVFLVTQPSVCQPLLRAGTPDVISYIRRNPYLWKRKQNREAVVSARSIANCWAKIPATFRGMFGIISRYLKICIHVFPVLQNLHSSVPQFLAEHIWCSTKTRLEITDLAFFLSLEKCTVFPKLALLLQKRSYVRIVLLLILPFPTHDDNFLMPNEHASFNAPMHAHLHKSN